MATENWRPVWLIASSLIAGVVGPGPALPASAETYTDPDPGDWEAGNPGSDATPNDEPDYATGYFEADTQADGDMQAQHDFGAGWDFAEANPPFADEIDTLADPRDGSLVDSDGDNTVSKNPFADSLAHTGSETEDPTAREGATKDPAGASLELSEEEIDRLDKLNAPRLGRNAWAPVDEWGNIVETPMRSTHVSTSDGQVTETVTEYAVSPDGELIEISSTVSTRPAETASSEIVVSEEPGLGSAIATDRAATPPPEPAVIELGRDNFEIPSGSSVGISERDLDAVINGTIQTLSEDRLASTTDRYSAIHGDAQGVRVFDIAVELDIGIVTSVEIDGEPSDASYVDAVQRGIARSLPSPDLSGANSLMDYDESGAENYSGSAPGNDGSYEEVGNLGLSGAAG